MDEIDLANFLKRIMKDLERLSETITEMAEQILDRKPQRDDKVSISKEARKKWNQ